MTLLPCIPNDSMRESYSSRPTTRVTIHPNAVVKSPFCQDVSAKLPPHLVLALVSLIRCIEAKRFKLCR